MVGRYIYYLIMLTWVILSNIKGTTACSDDDFFYLPPKYYLDFFRLLANYILIGHRKNVAVTNVRLDELWKTTSEWTLNLA